MSLNVVIMGQGYVGLPLAKALSAIGDKVLGFDIDKGLTSNLNLGISHVEDVSADDLSRMLRAGYSATSDEIVLSEADVVVICVPTPLDSFGKPNVSFIENAGTMISRHLKHSSLVILESTTYPGTTKRVLRPQLELSGRVLDVDYYLAFSPERIDPGNPIYGIENTAKVVGGESEKSTRRATEFYSRFISEVHPTKGSMEAEMAKLLENTYRHVNIALVNELAILCHGLGVDIWDVIRAASTKPYGFNAFFPGPGVGGHCIPVDPEYLRYEVNRQLGQEFKFVATATEVNRKMPSYVTQRIEENLLRRGLAMDQSRILLIGMSYKPDISDTRESPGPIIYQHLLNKGSRVHFFDPHVPQVVINTKVYTSEIDLSSAASYDLVVILQSHRELDFEEITKSKAKVLDTRGVLPSGPDVELL